MPMAEKSYKFNTSGDTARSQMKGHNHEYSFTNLEDLSQHHVTATRDETHFQVLRSNVTLPVIKSNETQTDNFKDSMSQLPKMRRRQSMIYDRELDNSGANIEEPVIKFAEQSTTERLCHQ